MPDHFILEKDGHITTLTFNRPEKRNPMNEEILLELEGLLHQIRDDAEVRILILTGTGNTFSSGADLSQTKGITDPQERERIFATYRQSRGRLVGRILHTLVHLEPITIAAVNGYAVGGGWALVLGCDFRIAVEGAHFWFPEVDLGVPLSPATTALLTAHVGPSLAKEIIITCRRYTAEELLPLGLLNQIVKKEAVSPTVRELANSLADKNPNAVIVSKATVNALALSHAVITPDLLLTRE